MSTKQTRSNAVLAPMPRPASPLEQTSAALRNRLTATIAKIVARERKGELPEKISDGDEVEKLTAELLGNPAAGEPSLLNRVTGQPLESLYLLRDALSAAIAEISNRIGFNRLDAALAYRAETAEGWKALQRDRALTIAKLRRLNTESRTYAQSVKVSLASQGLPCAEILMDAALLGRADMPGGPGPYFINQALKARYITKEDLDNA